MKPLSALLTFFVALMLLNTAIFAQTPNGIIEVNFKKLEKKYERTYDNRQTFVVHLTNINRNLYKVDGIKTETDYNTTVPAALTGIKLPAYLYTTPPVDEKRKAPFKGAENSVEVYAEIQKLLDTINAKAKNLDNATFLYNNLSHEQKNCIDTLDEIKRHVMGMTNEYLYRDKNYGAKTPKMLQDELEVFLYQQRKDTGPVLKKLDTLIKKYESLALPELIAGNADAKVNMQKIIDQLKNDRLTEVQKKRARLRISQYQQQIDELPKDKATFAATVEQLKQNQAKAQSAVEDMRKFEKDDKIYALIRLFQLLVNPANFEYTSELITAKTDEIKYVITVEPTELNTCDVNGKRTIEVTVKVNKGLKIDFSTGVFLNGGSDDFLGRTFYYQNIDADNRKIVAADRGSRYLLSVGALMHFYKRSTSNVKLGGSIGVSTTAAVTDLLFHTGPSLFFCNKNRIVLSAGLTLKSSSLLDQKLKMDTPYTKLQSPDTIPTVSVFPTAGYFFSITYNFTKLQNK